MDLSAALGVFGRKGAGKLRHVRVGCKKRLKQDNCDTAKSKALKTQQNRKQTHYWGRDVEVHVKEISWSFCWQFEDILLQRCTISRSINRLVQ